MYSDFVFLDRFLFELSCKNTHTHTNTHTQRLQRVPKNATINIDTVRYVFIPHTCMNLHEKVEMAWLSYDLGVVEGKVRS